MSGAPIQDTFDAEDGPRVRVRIHLNPKDRRHRWRQRQVIPPPVEVWALLDTGAECTCVTPGVAARLSLPVARFRMANAPGLAGLTGALVRDASFTIVHPAGGRHDLVLPELEVTELDLAALGYDALVGRDVLARCVLTYNGPAGSFTLGY